MSSPPQVLGASQQKALRLLGPILTPQEFYLAGGTALAMQLGHRRSVDLDWFTPNSIADHLQLAESLRDQQVPFTTGQVSLDTLYGTVAGVQVSFLRYRYPLLEPLVTNKSFGCHQAGLRDLAAMKLSALAQRGAKKDFVDVFALVQSGRSLSVMLDDYRAKFGVEDIGHLLVSLTYFDDADRERMPTMIWKSNWRGIKTNLRHWVRDLSN